ncbi:metal-dependent hydrolase [Aureispira sp. CCB-QB1]|uniref:metal-dependent hydrolase n=1 Tax=Aureispira sp. CCB-QB1 TaxID=1313421 RepID=UPI00069678A3|nr:metal-dependent hydrolase [Aureispira sp. CCB-QB1]
MDSITQATLGAAMGHAVLGEKMGNKAILVGAIAGTIPDLDIFSRLFLDHQVYGLVYHRGITHSIIFTLVASPIFAWLSLQYYKQGWHKSAMTQKVLTTWWLLFYGVIVAALFYLTYSTQSLVAGGLVGIFALGFIPLINSLKYNYEHRASIQYDPSLRNWTLMFFLAFLTHWIIDACTAYGTQIFEPFSRYRVAFNNISILDPLYTVPMIIGLVGVFFAKKYTKQRFWNYLGISIATLYMASTFYGKSIMNKVVANSLQEQGIEYTEYITYPTILNTVLWQTTVATDDAYYYGTYSLLDKQPTIEFIKLPKNHTLIDKYQGEEYLNILLWFANGYYNLIEQPDGSITFNNLRFGMMGVPEDSTIPLEDRYIFRFILTEKDGHFDVQEDRDVERIKVGEMAQTLWNRIKGK